MNTSLAQRLGNNLRFYILLCSVLLSMFVIAWLRLHITSNQLFYIRLEQVFGFLAVGYLYIALITSPLSKLFGKSRAMTQLVFARRAIGVSAAYFAVIHGSVALWGQIGGVAGALLLPDRFVWAICFGVFALVVLLLMAATSFDAVVKHMTFRRWKLLHRLVYVAGILIILHVWMIGTHVAYTGLQLVCVGALGVLFALEAIRLTRSFAQRFSDLRQKDYFVGLVICIWLVLMLLLLALPRTVRNYHQESHTTQSGAAMHE